MTPEEMIALGEKCLAEYEPRLKVVGPVKPYSGSAKKVKATFTDPLELLDETRLRHEISKVLDELASMSDGFRISEPEHIPAVMNYKVHTARQGNLNISFISMWDSKKSEEYNHVVCWYYPAS